MILVLWEQNWGKMGQQGLRIKQCLHKYISLYTLKIAGSKFNPKRVIFDPTGWVNYAPTEKGSKLTPHAWSTILTQIVVIINPDGVKMTLFDVKSNFYKMTLLGSKMTPFLTPIKVDSTSGVKMTLHRVSFNYTNWSKMTTFRGYFNMTLLWVILIQQEMTPNMVKTTTIRVK